MKIIITFSHPTSLSKESEKNFKKPKNKTDT